MTTQAEHLLMMAEEVANPSGEAIIMTGVTTKGEFSAVLHVATKLRTRDKLFVFRSIAEDWDYGRIVRELDDR